MHTKKLLGLIMKKYIIIILTFANVVIGQTQSQINQAKKIIKNSNMSANEARAMAKSQGLSDKQIDAISKKEVDGLKLKNESKQTESLDAFNIPSDLSNDITNEAKNQDMENSMTIETSELEVVDDSEIDMESKSQTSFNEVTYFGYDIFKRDPALFQSSSVGAVDPNYLIGPGDEIIVMLWGETQFRQVLAVDREGFIFIPEVGQVFVNGLTLNLLESKLFRVLSQSYASLNPSGKKATTFLDVSLGNLRPLRIQVLGEVNQPGAYTVSPSATLFSALYYFNGPTTLGSLRDIRLIRGGDELVSIDFYDYLLTGKKPQDQKLQLDDVIFIPKRLRSVSIQGEINRPGIYELKPNETLQDIILMARDLKITAYMDRAQIDRIIPFDERSELGMDRMFIDVNLENILESDQSFELQDGDRINIFSIMDLRQNVVSLSGAVERPGNYDLGESLSLSELIIKADSLLGDAYLERVDVVRVKPDFTEELIKLNLTKVINKEPDHDILLQSMDRVKVYSMTEMIPKTYVSITGHVKNPGRYLLRENITLYDLIFKAGGFIDEEFKKLTYLERAELVRIRFENNKKEIIPFDLGGLLNGDLIGLTLLQPDDAVRIYSLKEIEGATRYVSINGHVKRPGEYELFESNMTLYDLIFKAGGFDDPIFRSMAFLDRADVVRYELDGISQKLIPFNLRDVLDRTYNLDLEPGDEVKVYSRKVYNDVRTVKISGQVNLPGAYGYKNNMTLKDLILEAGGVSKDVFRYRIEIARVDPNIINENTYAQSFEIEMKNDYTIIKSGILFDKNKSFKLQPYDHIYVRQDPYFSMQKKVQILGSVYYPGEYAILNPMENVFDLIERAGGLRPEANTEASIFIRNQKYIKLDVKKIMKKPNSTENIKILEGDSLIIPSKLEIIQITGEVNVPGFYRYTKGHRVSDVIREAGGLSDDANKKGIHIIYANGKSKKYNRFFRNPKISDGVKIVIPKNPEEEPFDITEYSKELTSIIASVVQAVTVVVLARN
ncbi:MAG: hypothetical protein CMG60_00855 [Candidatus Marinimicrobia bacterium]|nr:hypothetical protein [Candidatus Neomarinimicrobiota bacterium]